jgi:hypothetical protein
MEKEEIFSFCKDEVNRLINKHKLTVDDETVQDFAYMSYMDCNKYWIDKGKEINEKIIKIFVKRTMFLKMTYIPCYV